MANFSAFGSALGTVASKVVTAKKFIYNVAALNNYSALYYLLAGKPMSEYLRAGSDVRARVKFTANSKVGWYNVSNDDHAPQISETGAWVIAYWAAHMAQETWKEEELLVNSGGITEGDLAEETWTQELWSKMQTLITSLHNSLSQGIWALPNVANMAGNDPLQPHSIPCYLNEYANALFGSGEAFTGYTAWTAVNTIDPVVYPGYRPYVAGYGAGGSGFTVNNIANLIFALSVAMRRTSLIPPPMNKEYFDPEAETDIDRSGGVIFASADGVARAEFLYRSSQDRWQDWMDPAGNPRFKNVQFVHEAQLDTAALYPNNATVGSANTFVTESVTPTAGATPVRGRGPRYYGVNAKYMKMYFHRKRFLEFLEPFREAATTYTQHVNTLGTMLCPDRSKHFLLYPLADQY